MSLTPPDGGANTTSAVRENPWLGLDSFKEEQAALFFGRSVEIAEMENMVMRGPASLLFGRSGLGKTSLLRAGVFPRLRSKDCLPVYVRLNFAAATSLVKQVKDALSETIKESQIAARQPTDDETLWEYTHREDVDFWDRRVRLITPVLVFDQFEEIFTLGKESVQAEDKVALLLEELLALVNNTPPEKVRQKFEDNPEAVADFDFAKRTVKVLIGLREDYLAHFEALRKRCPAAGTNRMRLEPLNGRQALEVVLKPGQGLVDEAVAQQIVEFVARDKNQPGDEPLDLERLERRVVDPSLLSVVCKELNDRRVKAGQPKITADLLTSSAKDEILLNFYERAIGDQPEPVRRFVEDHLLTGAGYRDHAALEDAKNEPGVTEKSLDTLVDRRLIRREEKDGVTWLELTHDLLTDVVSQSRKRRKERQAEEGRRKEQQQIEEARRKAERDAARSKRITAVVAGIALVALISMGIALILWVKAKKARENFERQVQEASKEDLFTAEQLFDEDQWGRGIAYLGHALNLNPANSNAAVHFWSAVVYGRHGDGRFPTNTSAASNVTYALFSPDGARVLIASGNRSSIFDTTTGETIWSNSNLRAKLAAFSPDGKLLLTVDVGNQAQIWETNNQAGPICTLTGTPSLPMSAAFSPDGRQVVVTGVDNHLTAGLWDTNGTLCCTLTNQYQSLSWVLDAAFSPDGKYVVTAGGTANTAYVWDARAGKLLSDLRGTNGHADWVMAVAFSRTNGNRVVTSSNDGTARVWDWRHTNCLAVLRHSGRVLQASFSADDSCVVTASADGTAQIWDPVDGHRLADPMRHNARVNTAALISADHGAFTVLTQCADNTAHLWSFDGANAHLLGEPLQHGRNNRLYDAALLDQSDSKVATVASEGLGVWNINSNPPGRLLQHAGGKVWSARFSPDGRELLTACADGIARIWDATNGAWKTSLTNDVVADMRDAVFSPNGQWIVTAGPSNIARVWRDDGKPLWTLDGHAKYIRMAKFDSTGHRVITACMDGTARIFDLGQEPALPTHLQSAVQIPPDGAKGAMLWASFSSNGQFVVTANSDHTAGIWNATNGQLIQLIQHNDTVVYVTFSADGRSVATACQDGTVHTATLASNDQSWETNAMIYSITNTKINVVQFSPDGHLIAAGADDGTVEIWKIGETNSTEAKRGGVYHKDQVNALGFKELSGGLCLLTGSADRTARIWKVPAKGPIVPFCEPFPQRGEVLQASFSPDGQYVATACEDKTAGLWKVPPDITWGDSMTNLIESGHKRAYTVGDALAAAISGFRFYTNSGDIQQISIDDRRELRAELETNSFVDKRWQALLHWWQARSLPASSNPPPPWPQDP